MGVKIADLQNQIADYEGAEREYKEAQEAKDKADKIVTDANNVQGIPGKIKELLEQVKAANPGNPDLKALEEKYKDATGNDAKAFGVELLEFAQKQAKIERIISIRQKRRMSLHLTN